MTNKQICAQFWAEFPAFRRVPGNDQNDYPADVRVSFCDFVEGLARAGHITEAQAARVTLK